MMRLLAIVNIAALAYFALLNTVYITLTFSSLWRLRHYVARLKSLYSDDLLKSAGGLPISLLVPAYNEAMTIVESVRSFLTLEYPEYEIVVVNDGSTDATLQQLAAAFALEPARRRPTGTVATEPVRGVYRSANHPSLWVVDKENGGGKADATNAGLNHARFPLVCVMDADTLLEPDALIRVVRPFLEDRRTVAAGGIVRIINGCRVEDGSVVDVRLPRSWAARFQVLEYFRAFLAGRVGWDAINGTLIISGAFGVFRRGVLVEAGGFSRTTVGEDMDLIVRLHRRFRSRGAPYRVTYIPDPVAWTEAPERWKDLGSQRDRWQRGLAQVMYRNRGMFFNPRYGSVGMVSIPYFVIFELFGPIIELGGYIAFIVTLALGMASLPHVIAFLALAVFLGSGLSISAVALEELSFRRYRRRGDLLILLMLGLVETLGYRQANTLWRLRGLVSAIRGKSSWGAMERTGFGGDQRTSEFSTRV